ncbi:MAG: hypothetical protein KDD89_00030 [Anaerolineales bacterium]|nr:hypothetical protein [Anaerolineales bacterium]
MNHSALDFLFSATGQQWLADTAVALREQTHLAVATHLRQQLTPDQTHAILETVLLREKASRKFSRASQMYFTRDGLEQASGEVVAEYRAVRFARAGIRQVADLGCGLGGDAVALTAVAEVIGVDRDDIRLRLAQKNVAAYGHEDRFTAVQADLHTWSARSALQALFFDPARRDEHGRRLYSVQAYQPPLSLWETWRTRTPHTAVKISPSVAYEELPPHAEAEFISVAGEVKECLLWTGDLHSGVARRATLLPSGATLTTAVLPPEIPIGPPHAFLYEPDGAVIRAHLVETLAAQLGAHKLSDEIAYLTADERHETPFARCFAVWDAFPFQLKRLRHYLRERQVGQVVVKKRGSPLEPDWLRQKLRLKGDPAVTAVVFLTQLGSEPLVVVGEEVG